MDMEKRIRAFVAKLEMQGRREVKDVRRERRRSWADSAKTQRFTPKRSR